MNRVMGKGRWALVLGFAALAACGKEPPPSPDRPQPAVPNLAGMDVMVVPAHPGPGGVPAGFDEAFAEFLTTESTTVDWILPPELERAAARVPWMELRPRSLAVGLLRAPEEDRMRDPLWGDLRRLGGLVDGRLAVIPYRTAYVAAPDSVGGHGRIEVAAAIVDSVSGRILWRGLVAGERGPAGDEVVLATAVQALVRMVAPVE